LKREKGKRGNQVAVEPNAIFQDLVHLLLCLSIHSHLPSLHIPPPVLARPVAVLG